LIIAAGQSRCSGRLLCGPPGRGGPRASAPDRHHGARRAADIDAVVDVVDGAAKSRASDWMLDLPSPAAETG